MKKILIITIIVQLLILVACNSSTSEHDVESDVGVTEGVLLETKEEVEENEEMIDELKFKIVSDWSAHLWFEEYLYGDMLWVLSYVENFLDNPTWENLQMARTVLCTAESYIDMRKPQEQTATLEEYKILIGKGYDITAVPISMGQAEQDKDTILDYCKQLKYGLFNEVFWETTYENFSTYVQYLIEYCKKEMEYVGYETNYLLTIMQDEELKERLQNFTKENYPYFTQYCPEFLQDTDILEQTLATTLSELENIILEMELLLGDAIIAVDDFTSMIENQEYDKLNAEAVEIGDIPFMLPQVYWEDIEDANYQYYNENEDGSLEFLKEQEQLLQSCDGCVIECTNVEKEDVIAYKNDLLSIGIEPFKVVEEDEILGIYYMFGEISLIIQWENGVTKIYMMDGELCFVPMWYFDVWMFVE